MTGKIILAIATVAFFLIGYRNLQGKKDLEVPAVLENKMKFGLVILPIVFAFIAYELKTGILGLVFGLAVAYLAYSVNSASGFTKDEFIYFGGFNVLLSKRKIADLKYINIDLRFRNGLSRVEVRGNLLKRKIYFASKYETKIEALAKKWGVKFYPIGQGPETKNLF